MEQGWLDPESGLLVVLGGGHWHGIGSSGTTALSTDYALACQVVDYCGRVEALPDSCLVLGDMPMPAALCRTPSGFLVARWLSCKDQQTARTALAAVPLSLPQLSEAVDFRVTDHQVKVIDAAYASSETTNFLQLTVAPGVYRVDSERFASPGVFEFIVHRFTLSRDGRGHLIRTH